MEVKVNVYLIGLYKCIGWVARDATVNESTVDGRRTIQVVIILVVETKVV